MIRQPTPDRVALEWWQRSVSGERLPRSEDDPQAGYYRLKNLRGGPWVPVAIWIERDVDPQTGELTNPERIVAIANGRPIDPNKIWLSARPISLAEYDALTGAREFIPEMANVREEIDLNRLSPIKP